MKNKVWMVYDTKNNECLIGQFENHKDIADYFNMELKSVGCAITRHYKVKGRYSIERVYL